MRKASRKAVRERWRRWTRAPEVGPLAAAARGSGGDGSTREAAPSGRRIAAAKLRDPVVPRSLWTWGGSIWGGTQLAGKARTARTGADGPFVSWATASDGPGRIGEPTQ